MELYIETVRGEKKNQFAYVSWFFFLRRLFKSIPLPRINIFLFICFTIDSPKYFLFKQYRRRRLHHIRFQLNRPKAENAENPCYVLLYRINDWHVMCIQMFHDILCLEVYYLTWTVFVKEGTENLNTIESQQMKLAVQIESAPMWKNRNGTKAYRPSSSNSCRQQT